jgi:hypothetical protein
LARALGQPFDELDYLDATLASHSSLLSVLTHYETDEGGTTTYFVRRADVPRMAEIGRMALDYYLRALEAASAILSWSGLGVLAHIRAQTNAQLAELGL